MPAKTGNAKWTQQTLPQTHWGKGVSEEENSGRSNRLQKQKPGNSQKKAPNQLFFRVQPAQLPVAKRQLPAHRRRGPSHRVLDHLQHVGIVVGGKRFMSGTKIG